LGVPSNPNGRGTDKSLTQIIIDGKPNAKERPYFSTKNGKVRVFTPSKTSNFENYVKQVASPFFHYPIQGPIELSIKFFLPRPKYLIWKTKPMPFVYSDKRPDIDNLVKSVVDGLKGIAFHDDAQISMLLVTKGYHSGDEGPKTIVNIKTLINE
jgi:Holliday junction resolvase RusA-like endonuclease